MEAAGSHTPLIHGLPDEISLLCLARVPRRYHDVLRCVCRRWRALLRSDDWHSCRQKNNWDETWIYVLCKSKGMALFVLAPNPRTRILEGVQVIVPPCTLESLGACSGREGISIETLGKKLYLLGGCSWQKDATDEVCCYDASSNHWERAAPMPTARCYFVSAALNDKLYLTSGHGLTDKSPNSWDIYDSVSNTWSSHKNPMLTPDIVKFVALDGKLVTIHKATWNRTYFAGIYDPSGSAWRGTENEIALCWSGPTVVVDGTLYMLDQSFGTKLMRWQKESKEWIMLGRLSDQLTRPPCELVAIGRKIYVIGKGLSSLVIDVDVASVVGRFLLSSSFGGPILDDNHVPVSCKAITI